MTTTDDAPIDRPIAAPAATPAVAPDRFLSDRCNPILVREVVQTLAGRGFSLLLLAAVFAVLLLTLIVATTDVMRYDDIGSGVAQRGSLAFAGAMVCLAPIAMFLIPIGAFNSMRAEVQSGVAEQLLMTRLRPWSILLGKLLAAQVQVVLFVSVFAPFLAFGWLLRGIDVRTIAVALLLILLLNLVASAFAVAGGAVAFNKSLAGLAHALVSVGLVLATFPTMMALSELPRELGAVLGSGTIVETVTGIGLTAAMATGLCLTVGMAALGHAHENRSTPFRVWLIGGLATLVASTWLFAESSGAPDAAEAAAYLIGIAALVGAPIWLWACCETPTLSPRVRILVPRRGWVAMLAAPWLPGGSRGAMFVIGAAAVAVALALGVPALFGEVQTGSARRFVLSAWAYVLAYAALARLLRRRASPRPAGSVRTLILVIMIALLATVLPPLLLLLLNDGLQPDWHPLYFASPLLTLSRLDGLREFGTVAWLVAGASCAVLALDVMPGTREVLAASAARRRRAA